MYRKKKNASRKTNGKANGRHSYRKFPPSPLMQTVRDNLKSLRMIRGITQKELAESLGVSQAYWSSTECGKHAGARKIHIDQLFYAAAALGAPAHELLIPGQFRYDGPPPQGGRPTKH